MSDPNPVRRSFLTASGGGIAGAAAGVLLSACGGSSAETKRLPTVVLVHGGWHGAWCWSRIQPMLAAAGINSVAFDLPGAGFESKIPSSFLANPFNPVAFASQPSPVASVTMTEMVDRAKAVVQAVAAQDGPVILLGHSIGGPIVSAVAEALPALVRGTVYLSAFVPARLPVAVAYLQAFPEFSTAVTTKLLIPDPTAADPAAALLASGAARINPASSDPVYAAQVKDAFFGYVSADDFTMLSRFVVPDSPSALLTGPVTVTAAKWGSVRRTYIRCLEDHSLPIAAADRFIAEADTLFPQNKFTQVTVDVPGAPSDHSPFLSRPARLASLLADIVRAA